MRTCRHLHRPDLLGRSKWAGSVPRGTRAPRTRSIRRASRAGAQQQEVGQVGPWDGRTRTFPPIERACGPAIGVDNSPSTWPTRDIPATKRRRDQRRPTKGPYTPPRMPRPCRDTNTRAAFAGNSSMRIPLTATHAPVPIRTGWSAHGASPQSKRRGAFATNAGRPS